MPLPSHLGAAALAAALLLPAAANAFPIYTPPPTATEFVNDVTGHYVMLRDLAEIAAVEAGAAGPGWRRTGYSFVVMAPGTQVADGNVCRFYAPGPNTHFYTGDAAECAYLREHATGWNFEAFEFSAALAHGGCGPGAQPVYRLYNNRWMFNDSNHRYTPDPEVRAEMMARGWIDEGVAFCTAWWDHAPAKSFTIVSGKLMPSVTHCENESINLGSCTGLNQLPLMPNAVTQWLPPFWVTPNPDYPVESGAVTGVSGAHQLETAYPIADRAAVVAHSFLHTDGESALFGIHVNAADRTEGDYSSINPLYQFGTRPEERVFPWEGLRDRDLVLSFELQVARLRLAGAGSQAYGHPTLQLIDRASGEQLYVTVGAYGSIVPGDFVARDVVTRRVIVSTVFREQPAFGRRLAGDWIACAGAGPCSTAESRAFKFRIGRADFARVLASARSVNPALSADPADFFLTNFHFNNEVYRDGEIGVRLSGYRLEIFER